MRSWALALPPTHHVDEGETTLSNITTTVLAPRESQDAKTSVRQGTPTGFTTTPYGEALKQLRKENASIRRRLRRNGGNATLTAKELGYTVERVRRIKANAGIETDRSLWPAVRGAREVEKLAVLGILESGGSVKRAARETGVPESTVRSWRNTWGLPRPGAQS